MYDRNGDGCPPSGEDCREVDGIEIVTEDGKKLPLAGQVFCQIEEFFESEIMDADLPTREECDE
jgi:hypothetical protein